jgi:hypothetical protein
MVGGQVSAAQAAEHSSVAASYDTAVRPTCLWTTERLVHSPSSYSPMERVSDPGRVNPLVDVAPDPTSMAIAQPNVVRAGCVDATFSLGGPVVQR